MKLVEKIRCSITCEYTQKFLNYTPVAYITVAYSVSVAA